MTYRTWPLALLAGAICVFLIVRLCIVRAPSVEPAVDPSFVQLLSNSDIDVYFKKTRNQNPRQQQSTTFQQNEHVDLLSLAYPHHLRNATRKHTESLDISIHVFAWRRAKSLKRLLSSLQEAEYGAERNIPLFIHLDFGSTVTVKELASSFIWNFGEKKIVESPEKMGILKMMIHSWMPKTDSSLAIFLEDDVQVSPLYFQYAKWCSKWFIFQASDRTKTQPQVAGCSLYTPRLDEISPTPDPQNPPMWLPPKLEQGAGVFLFQLPCSWGAVYLGKYWRNFTQYALWRISSNSTADSFPPVPGGARSNTWTNSWKRFLIEYMYLNALVVLYPSFPNQTSFSTNHYEAGVHSVPDGAQIAVPDLLREDVDVRFTVPVFSRSDHSRVQKALRLFEGMSTADLLTVALSHKTVRGLPELTARAKEYQNEVRRAGYNLHSFSL
ncbi:hypothetical protein HDU83_001188 [Entophlyctis luteolus]|nr:hypothetical protein HDU82_003451 [Entophlyctis luteolus]KAJ3356397.1 hypothetical protein HDU83_001188 [Entophlyctis luteolus]KAJ3394996.1 hypothetical protein HDU84_004454 [Entophlyctis sp. JEL0112]